MGGHGQAVENGDPASRSAAQSQIGPGPAGPGPGSEEGGGSGSPTKESVGLGSLRGGDRERERDHPGMISQQSQQSHHSATNSGTSTQQGNFSNSTPTTLDEKLMWELLEKKKEAVALEDYTEAKRIKEEIERLQRFARKLRELETMKAEAVAIEDYDAAKR